MEVPERALHVPLRRRHHHCASGGWTSEVGERRYVQPQPFSVRLLGRVCAPPTRDRLRPKLPRREHPSSERQRPRDDAAPPIEHFNPQLRPAESRVERARSRQQRGSRRTQLRNLDCALAQRPVKRTMEIARREDIHAGADDDDRQHDPADRREHRTAEQRAHRQRPRTKPEPRTVSIRDGSPSFRRRYEM